MFFSLPFFLPFSLPSYIHFFTFFLIFSSHKVNLSCLQNWNIYWGHFKHKVKERSETIWKESRYYYTRCISQLGLLYLKKHRLMGKAIEIYYVTVLDPGKFASHWELFSWLVDGCLPAMSSYFRGRERERERTLWLWYHFLLILWGQAPPLCAQSMLVAFL